MSRRFRGEATVTLTDADGTTATFPVDPEGIASTISDDLNGWNVVLAEDDWRGDVQQRVNVGMISRAEVWRALHAVPAVAPQEHALGATVCAPGHRYPLTVVAWNPDNMERVDLDHPTAYAWDAVPVYVLVDERDPSTQPHPIVRAPAGTVKAYGWRELLELSGAPENGRTRGDSRWPLEHRPDYLDACAHLHDLGDHDNADELLNEAAQKWWSTCESCDGAGCRSGLMPGPAVPAWEAEEQMNEVLAHLREVHFADDYESGRKKWTGKCSPCTASGRVCRITDARRLYLVECLIAAGLPGRRPAVQPAIDEVSVGPGHVTLRMRHAARQHRMGDDVHASVDADGLITLTSSEGTWVSADGAYTWTRAASTTP